MADAIGTRGPWRVWVSEADAQSIASVGGAEKARLWSVDDIDVIKDMVGLALDRIRHANETTDDGLSFDLLKSAEASLKHAWDLMSVHP